MQSMELGIMRNEPVDDTFVPERETLPPPVDRAWFQRRLADLGRTQVDLANALGVRPAAISLLLNGRRSARAPEVAGMAVFLDVPVQIVLDRLGAAAPSEIPPTPPATPSDEAPVIGFLMDGDTVERAHRRRHPGPFAVPRPPDLTDAEAVVVVGSHAAPRYLPGDVIYFSRSTAPAPASLIGRPVVGATRDGALFVKRMAAGSRPDLFTLLSYSPLIEPMLNQSLAWVAPVSWVRPA